MQSILRAWNSHVACRHRFCRNPDSAPHSLLLWPPHIHEACSSCHVLPPGLHHDSLGMYKLVMHLNSHTACALVSDLNEHLMVPCHLIQRTNPSYSEHMHCLPSHLPGLPISLCLYTWRHSRLFNGCSSYTCHALNLYQQHMLTMNHGTLCSDYSW